MMQKKEIGISTRPNIRKRFKRYVFDRYFRWEVDSLLAQPQNVVNEKFERDEYQMWLSFAIPGMLDWRNLRLFDHCIRNLPSKAPIVEIGSFAGLSLNNLTYLLRKQALRNPVFSVDEWILHEGGADPGKRISKSRVTNAEFREHIKETFRRNVMLFSGDPMPHHIPLSSDAFFAQWAAGATAIDFFGQSVNLGGPISFAYIDGDHRYEQSFRDFINVDRWLEPGGFIVFDDSADSARSPTGQVWGCNRTAREASALPRYRVVDKSYHYCIQKTAQM